MRILSINYQATWLLGVLISHILVHLSAFRLWQHGTEGWKMIARSITASRIHKRWCNSHDTLDIKMVTLQGRADQNANPVFVLFYLGVLPSLCQESHEDCTNPYEFLLQWYFWPSLFIPRSPCYYNRNTDKWIVMCEINTPSNYVAW